MTDSAVQFFDKCGGWNIHSEEGYKTGDGTESAPVLFHFIMESGFDMKAWRLTISGRRAK